MNDLTGMSAAAPRGTPGTPSLLALLLMLPAVAGAAGAAEWQTVHFKTSDGLTIAADYYPPELDKTPAPIVICLHMYRSNRKAWRPLAGPLHEAGFAVLAIDMRGHGDSATEQTRRAVIERETAVFDAMTRDVRAAYTWLVRQKGVDPARFAVIGASVGCSVALRYAALDPSVDAVVCLSPGLNYLGLDSRADIRKIKGRRLWLVAAADARERKGAEGLAPLCQGAEKTIVPGKLHGTGMFRKVPGIEDRVVAFVRANIGGPGKTPVYGGIGSDRFFETRAAAQRAIRPADLRVLSSAREARARGLHKARS